MLQNNQRFRKIYVILLLVDLMRRATKACAPVCQTISGTRILIVDRNAQWILIVLASKRVSIKIAWILVQAHAVVMHVAMLLIMSQCAVVHLVIPEIRSFYASHIYRMVSFTNIFLRLTYFLSFFLKLYLKRGNKKQILSFYVSNQLLLINIGHIYLQISLNSLAHLRLVDQIASAKL